MPLTIHYHCRNCGHEFATEILTRDEAQKARDRGERLGQVRCPKCSRADLDERKAA